MSRGAVTPQAPEIERPRGPRWDRWTPERRVGAFALVAGYMIVGWFAAAFLNFLLSVCNPLDPGYAAQSSKWIGVAAGAFEATFVSLGWFVVAWLRRTGAPLFAGIVLWVFVMSTVVASWPPHWCLF